ncbi:MAG TPA: ATP-binding protein [Anaeromyxobacteraceae bacterium]|nr:ATP-binding protein [Anaeromyxobacteraceae bacterium]
MLEGATDSIGGGGVPPPAEHAVPAGTSGPEASPAGAGRGAERVTARALEAIPWRHRLSTQLLAMVAVLTLAAVGGFMGMEWVMQQQRLRNITRSVELFSETIKSSTWRAMLADHRPDAYATMEVIGRQRGIEHVRIFNKEGRITFSTVPEEIGEMVDKRAEACYACHSADQPLARPSAPSRARIYGSNGHRVLGMVTPIPNDRSCTAAACHAHKEGQQILGVLDVGLSLAPLDHDIAAIRRSTLVATGVGLMILAAFLYLFARRQVVLPVAALLEGTRRVSRDELDVEIRTPSRGELGFLAASFNDMTRALRRLKADLHHFTEGLEAKVEERTAELRTAHEQLVRTEKLSSLGKLSASIAHEINNPLAGILTFAKLMIRTLEGGLGDETTRKALIRNLGLVQRETERCSAIVRNLLDFARERPLSLKPVNVNQVVSEALSLIANQAAILNVVMEKDLAPVPPVEADYGQLRQAFVNIALNAVEAMPQGGRLSVITRALREPRLVEISFADNGPGIPLEVARKIFDPFFTTKERGTGLGLSVVYGIVSRHHGKVEVDTAPGKGTRFDVHLPFAERQE